ncbi:protein FAR1-RELATED SEQUENCE 5-like [Rosa rugosa]|uniref:protein FAR1-RELATED SEQUENCE 5-like n=1 Tax=Rosa rugosa TaxID=74645 RepID=UPI002B406F23|nr:protein FAR1-RELATED SEQUENCE 5-like [Rosa rugosa]
MDRDDSTSPDYKPRNGMEFDSEELAYEFYNMYGRRVGFSIRRHTHYKNKHSGKLISRIFVCSKEGLRTIDKRDHLTKNPRAETRTSCDAKMIIKLDKSSGRYRVVQYEETHSHDLVIQECAHMLPSQRNVTSSQGAEMELAQDSGIPLKLSFELMGREVGGREALGFTKQDQKNYLQSQRQKKLAYGEAGCLLKYFQNQALENPSFFYAMQLDSDEQITNIFWADARMILDYGLFGDVVSFDTTYRTNEANRPFGVFVGFNHHRETVIFGAALMYDETSDSFTWLFETFLEAMSNKAPKSIFTDQDAAMAKACANVMPNTYHLLCTWHIMQNAIKKASSIFKGDDRVTTFLSKCMNNYEEEDEFLLVWEAMLSEYGVHDNPWLTSIFRLKEKWAKPYVKWAWTAGMHSTQLSESFNASLKPYVKSDYDVVQFFKHFDRLLNDKRYKELEAEYALCYKLPAIGIFSSMVIKAGNIYTKAAFEEFQIQYEKALDYNLVGCIQDGDDIVYKVAFNGHPKERCVRVKKDHSVSCSCRLFEIEGILCRHAIKILTNYMNVKEIPDQYILKRWTRKARSERVKDMYGQDIQVDTNLQQTSWYKSLSSISTKISSRAAEREETYQLALHHLGELSKAIEDMLCSKMDTLQLGKNDQITPSSTVIEGIKMANSNSENAKVVQAKGFKKRESARGRKKRIIGDFEKSLAKNRKGSPLEKEKSSSSDSTKSGNYGAPIPMLWMSLQESQSFSYQALLNSQDFLDDGKDSFCGDE